jgi:hypothetical protein
MKTKSLLGSRGKEEASVEESSIETPTITCQSSPNEAVEGLPLRLGEIRHRNGI